MPRRNPDFGPVEVADQLLQIYGFDLAEGYLEENWEEIHVVLSRIYYIIVNFLEAQMTIESASRGTISWPDLLSIKFDDLRDLIDSQIEETLFEDLSGANFPFAVRLTGRPNQNFAGFNGIQEQRIRIALGGKALGIIFLDRLGLKVPAAYCLVTELSRRWAETMRKKKYGFTPLDHKRIFRTIRLMEIQTHKRFGDITNPLLISVRSGSEFSLPGLGSTVLYVGLNEDTVVTLAKEIGELNAWRAYYKLIYTIAKIKLGENDWFMNLPLPESDELTDLPKIKQIIGTIKKSYSQLIDPEYSHFINLDNPDYQLIEAVQIVFYSLFSEKAKRFIAETLLIDPATLGTGVIFMEMVFTGENGGSGVMHTRGKTYEPEAVITYAPGKQGDHVVGNNANQTGTLEVLPAYIRDQMRGAIEIIDVLKKGYPQDVEFTLGADGNLNFLQVRDAHMTPIALLRYLVEKIEKGELSSDESMRLISPQELSALFNPPLDDQACQVAIKEEKRLIATGDPIGLGNATGICINDIAQAKIGKKYILFIDDANKFKAGLENTQFPPNIVGLVVQHLSHGSHLAIHLTVLGKPIIGGVNISNYLNQEITIDTVGGRVFKGDIERNGKQVILSQEENTFAVEWLEKYKANPWRYAGRWGQIDDKSFLNEQNSRLSDLEVTKAAHPSLKGQEIAVLNELIPEPYRISYAVIVLDPDSNSAKEYSSTEIEKIKTDLANDLKKIIRSGHHVTIRTCHTPQLAGDGPYVYLTSESEVDDFINNSASKLSRWGGFDSFFEPITDEDGKKYFLKELIVGDVPKDKLRKEEEIQSQHGVFTFTIDESGIMTISVIAGTPYVRTFEPKPENEEIQKNMISISFPAYSLNTKNTRAYPVVYGENLNQDPAARTKAMRYLEHVFGFISNLWQNESLGTKLALMQSVFSKSEGHRVIALEGQLRLPTDPKAKLTEVNSWIKIYGIKADLA